MRKLCVRSPEYMGCYTLPYEIEPFDEVRFEGGLFRVFVPTAEGLEEKHLYRPLA